MRDIGKIEINEKEILSFARTDARTQSIPTEKKPSNGQRRILSNPEFATLRETQSKLDSIDLDFAVIDESIINAAPEINQLKNEKRSELDLLQSRLDRKKRKIHDLEDDKEIITKQYIDRDLNDGESLNSFTAESKNTAKPNAFLAWWFKSQKNIGIAFLLVCLEGLLLYTQWKTQRINMDQSLVMVRILLLSIGYVMVMILLNLYEKFREYSKFKSYGYLFLVGLFITTSLGTTILHIVYDKEASSQIVDTDIASFRRGSSAAIAANSGVVIPTDPSFMKLVKDYDIVVILTVLGLMFLPMYTGLKNKLPKAEEPKEDKEIKPQPKNIFDELKNIDALIKILNVDVTNETVKLERLKSELDLLKADVKNEIVDLKTKRERLIEKRSELIAYDQSVKEILWKYLEIYKRDYLDSLEVYGFTNVKPEFLSRELAFAYYKNEI